jgi:hypothetical protein
VKAHEENLMSKFKISSDGTLVFESGAVYVAPNTLPVPTWTANVAMCGNHRLEGNSFAACGIAIPVGSACKMCGRRQGGSIDPSHLPVDE